MVKIVLVIKTADVIVLKIVSVVVKMVKIVPAAIVQRDCTCGDCSKDCDCGCQNSLNEKNTQEVSPESSEASSETSETSIPEAQEGFFIRFQISC